MFLQQKGRGRTKTVIVLAWIFTVVMLLLSSCIKDRAYDVDEKDGVRYVHNLKPKYDKPIASLEFIRQIGELEPEDESYMFNFPISVAADEDGNVFVLDSKESCIKKFNTEGKYLTRFGRPGQGPGELDNPMTIDCRQDKLLITSMASQFHLFDLDGKYIERFRLPQYQGFDLRLMSADSVVGFAMIPSGENTKKNKVLNIFDIEGNVLYEFGEPFLVETAKSSWVANFVRIGVDNEDNIFVNFISQNRIEKYSNTGNLLIKIDRKLPFDLEYKYEKKKMEVRGKVREYMDEVFPHVSRGIGIDSNGRIWVLALKKEIPRDIDMEDFVYTEYFDFEVYREDGILLTKVPIPGEMERFDNWSMYNDRLYFVDPFGQACVFVYKTIWK
ncbi:MAG: 6-bladed beta-propeller [Candidatus Aminicenantes bacterium]|nr:MAG: 6-bladed beta-propeller [Candidatus Aminicenantes bacterium]